ncbi:MAG: hypothetical protein JO147_08730 [Actinobacteria bacterium]|nr:hypothetical protein [Actinomycetota bacterium]
MTEHEPDQSGRALPNPAPEPEAGPAPAASATEPSSALPPEHPTQAIPPTPGPAAPGPAAPGPAAPGAPAFGPAPAPPAAPPGFGPQPGYPPPLFNGDPFAPPPPRPPRARWVNPAYRTRLLVFGALAALIFMGIGAGITALAIGDGGGRHDRVVQGPAGYRPGQGNGFNYRPNRQLPGRNAPTLPRRSTLPTTAPPGSRTAQPAPSTPTS